MGIKENMYFKYGKRKSGYLLFAVYNRLLNV
jgi:hypothetical protein